jgi:hypothetical protein
LPYLILVIGNLLLHVILGLQTLKNRICALHVIELIMIGLCKKENIYFRLFKYLYSGTIPFQNQLIEFCNNDNFQY